MRFPRSLAPAAPVAALVTVLPVVTVLLVAGCTAAPPPPPPGTAPPLPAGCTRTVTQPGEVDAALGGAAAGSTICFTGGALTGVDLQLRRSGTATAPITLAATGTTVRNLHVAADHVVVQGFTVEGGDGLLLQGTGLTARQNTVRDTQRGGIGCLPCTDATIEGNTVYRATSSGLALNGTRITARDNTLSATVPRGGGDADGVRFGGSGLRLAGNTVRDISEEGYASPPHPDCFQTFDGDGPTFDVVIAGNTCANVDAQCLIATGDRNGNAGVPPGVPSIVFAGNSCTTNGSQGVNLRRWPGVVLRDNRFAGPELIRGILIADGSTGCTVTGNRTEARNGAGDPVRPVEIDASSRPGTHEAGNAPS